MVAGAMAAACNGGNEPGDEKGELRKYDSILAPALKIYWARDVPRSIVLFDSIAASLPQPQPYLRALRYNWLYTDGTIPLAKSKAFLDTAILISDSEKLQKTFPASVAHLYYMRGNIAFKEGYYNEAYDYFFRGKQLTDSRLDTCGKAHYSYNIAMVLFRQKLFRESAKYFYEAYLFQETCPGPRDFHYYNLQQEVLDNIGECYYYAGQYDSALLFCRRSLAFTDNHFKKIFAEGDSNRLVRMAKAVAYGNMAKIDIQMGKYADAERLFKYSILINSAPDHDMSDAQHNRIFLAGLYQRQHRYADMARIAVDIKRILDYLPDKETELEWKNIMALYYQAIGNTTAQLHYYKDYITLRDSIEKARQKLYEADITLRLRNREQDLTISLLRKDNQLAKVYLWLSAAIILLVIIIVGVIYYSYRRSLQSLRLLSILNTQVNSQKESLEVANKEKDRIINVVAHDLRSPVGIAAYVADRLGREPINQTGENAELLQMVKTASDNALSLIQELLLLKQDPTVENIIEEDINIIVKNAVKMMSYQAEEKGQHIQLSIYDYPLSVGVALLRIQRVFVNLLGNAIKFSRHGEQILVHIAKEKNNALVTIRDNGIGIAKDILPHLFEIFTPARKEGTDGEKSFGLGLSISRQIVKEHNGNIWCESLENVGTTFYVYIPLKNQ